MDPQLRLTHENLPRYLEERGVAPAARVRRVSPAGDGNINWVRRIQLEDGRSWIVKQARPALERFPEYEVTTERIVFEARWYQTVRAFDSGAICPQVLDFDEAERVLVLEDLGEVERLDAALGRDPGGGACGAVLARLLGAVHAGSAGRPELAERFKNEDMRRLHGDHIFALPFQENGFPLSPALRARARALQADTRIQAAAAAAHARYLAPGSVLLHADVQSGNVLLQSRGPRLLDPEIAHVGDPAFDPAILLAHLLLPALARGRAGAARGSVTGAWEAYREARGPGVAPPFEEVATYVALECLRRTLGAARVAVVADDDAGEAVCAAASRWLLRPPAEPAGFFSA